MGDVIVICGPSGVGKTTLISKLLKEENKYTEFSVSYTTRSVRPGETPGVDYHYVTKKEFEEKMFYEQCTYSDNMYGTSVDEMNRIFMSNKIPILDVNIKSLQQLKSKIELKMLVIFVKPPEPYFEVLRRRLEVRSKTTQESAEAIDKRLSAAPLELKQCENEKIKNIITNDDLETSYEKLKFFVKPLLDEVKNKAKIISRNSKVEVPAEFVNSDTKNSKVEVPVELANSETKSSKVEVPTELVNSDTKSSKVEVPAELVNSDTKSSKVKVPAELANSDTKSSKVEVPAEFVNSDTKSSKVKEPTELGNSDPGAELQMTAKLGITDICEEIASKVVSLKVK